MDANEMQVQKALLFHVYFGDNLLIRVEKQAILNNNNYTLVVGY